MNRETLSQETFSDTSEPLASSRSKAAPTSPLRFIGGFLAFTAIILPLPFGAVHEQFYLPYSIIVAIVGVWVLVRQSTLVASLIKGDFGKTSQIVSGALIGTILYSLLQYLLFGLIQVDHPLLGRVSLQADSLRFVSGWRDLINFFAVFFIARLYLKHSHHQQRFITRVLLLSGFIVSLIALSHWFYDNGKLFWLFEPESVSVHTRARWPFVNPNHLGDFLLPIAFLTLGSVTNLFSRLFQHEMARGRRRNRTLVALLGSEDFHLKVLRPLVLCVPLLSMALAILASQSRGAWFGGAVGLTLFLLTIQRASPPQKDVLDQEKVVAINDRSSRRSRKGGRSEAAMRMDGSWALLLVYNSQRYLRPVLALTGVVLILIFLNSGGRELIAGRLEYGLLYSMEDIRWTFYANSWPMFTEHPFFGVGLGSWFPIFSQFASSELAGLNAVYLHSDPYQLLIELGLVGALPLIIAALAIITLAIKSIRAAKTLEQRVILSALLYGSLSLLLASLPEFPFRIPAIQMNFAIILALFLSHCEQQETTSV